MSYSIATRNKTRAAVRTSIVNRFETEVQASQPVHAKDRALFERTVDGVLELVPEEAPDGQQLCLSVSGSLGWTRDQDNITSASINANAYLMTDEPAKVNQG